MDIHIKEKLYFHVKKMQNHAENGTYNKSNTQWKEAEKRHSLLKIRNKGGKQKDN